MECKTIFFQGAYRLSGTGIVECLEITDVGCNLKQFDGLTWLTPTPDFKTDLRNWVISRRGYNNDSTSIRRPIDCLSEVIKVTVT